MLGDPHLENINSDVSSYNTGKCLQATRGLLLKRSPVISITIIKYQNYTILIFELNCSNDIVTDVYEVPKLIEVFDESRIE